MLNLLPGTSRTCEGISRRHFLEVGTLAGLGLSLPQLLASRSAQGGASAETNCILIWTRGGTSHHDTFDPKPDAPASVRGEFEVIDSCIPGVKVTEVCPRFARELGRFGLLRGWNPRNGSHGTADQYVMSGHKFNPSLQHPTYGSVISQQKGFRGVLPPFVQLGDNVDHRFGGGLPGFLGIEHTPFEVLADPNAPSFTVRDITPPAGIDRSRIDRRRTVLQTIDALQRGAERQPDAFEALDEHYRAAINIITSPGTQRAFELEREHPRQRDAYGRTRFGQSCLLARRLIEAGVRFVTVTDGAWDTHQNNFRSLKDRLMPPVDQALPQLVIDLAERGLLETTLVLWLTDFGRTPKINAASGRDHWASAGFALLAGAGVPGGSVLGKTGDDGGQVVDGEYFSEDLGNTLFAKMGIPHDLVVTTPDGRPVHIVPPGTLIREWM